MANRILGDFMSLTKAKRAAPKKPRKPSKSPAKKRKASKSPRKRKATSATSGKKKPPSKGTKAVTAIHRRVGYEVRKQQKGEDYLTKLARAKLAVKNAILDESGRLGIQNAAKIHVSSSGAQALHHVLEETLEHLFEEANRLVIHAKRKTVLRKDVLAAAQTVEQNIGNSTFRARIAGTGSSERSVSASDARDGGAVRQLPSVTKEALKRLARRAGIERIGRDFYGLGRFFYTRYAQAIVGSALTFMVQAKRRTLSGKHVAYALTSLNLAVPGFSGRR